MDLEDVPWGVSSEGVSFYGVGTYLHHMSTQPEADGLTRVLGVAHYPQVLSLLAHGYTPPEPGKKNIGLTAIEYLQVYSLCIVPPSHDPQRRTRYIWMPTQADISAHQPCRMWHSIVSEPIKIVSTQCLLVELGK